MLLNLDDAAKVTKRLVIDGMDDDDIIKQELEQKCWFPPKSNKAAEHLNNLIFDINPAEYAVRLSRTT